MDKETTVTRRARVAPTPVSVILLTLIVASSSRAEVRLAPLFGDHMVLQQDQPIRAWGTADPGEWVGVILADRKARVQADVQGAWRVELDPLPFGGPHELNVAGTNRITIKDVLIGEVWVCSGQSNMEWPVSQALHADREIAEANFPYLRLFTVRHAAAGRPRFESVGEWRVCAPGTVADFSAAGYFFGREVHRRRNVPVGLIQSAWGGTPAEAWTSLERLQREDVLQPILTRWNAAFTQFDQAIQTYEERFRNWVREAQQAETEGRPVPPMPHPPTDPRAHPHRPSGLFNAMIHPLIPFGIRGVIWYQGESNASRAYQYRTLFPAMIDDWRRRWNQGDFPFLFVQLANFRSISDEPAESAWAELREAQTMALKLPNTGMALAIDIGQADDIHPKNKQEVGRRLALAAEHIAYGQDIVHAGPMVESVSFSKNGRVVVTFKNAGGGLSVRGEGDLKGFALAGADRKFVWADARITGPNTVTAWSGATPEPVALRYGWADNPVCNLINQEGLPACPFRTDDWPGLTVNER